jgi:hypothetical protein
MTILTLKIDTRSKKAQYLLGLIDEIAKTDKSIQIISEEIPNRITRKAIEEIEAGKSKPVKSAKELFDSI